MLPVTQGHSVALAKKALHFLRIKQDVTAFAHHQHQQSSSPSPVDSISVYFHGTRASLREHVENLLPQLLAFAKATADVMYGERVAGDVVEHAQAVQRDLLLVLLRPQVGQDRAHRPGQADPDEWVRRQVPEHLHRVALEHRGDPGGVQQRVQPLHDLAEEHKMKVGLAGF